MLATSFSARCRCSQQLLRMVRIRNGRNLCSDKQQEEEMRNVLESSSKWSITNYYIIINSGTSSCCVSLKDKNALARARDEGMTQLLTCYLSVVFYYCSNNKPQGSSNALECHCHCSFLAVISNTCTSIYILMILTTDLDYIRWW